MSSHPISVLLIENEHQAGNIPKILDSLNISYRYLQDTVNLDSFLRQQKWSLIFCDYDHPFLNPVTVLEQTRLFQPQTPVILVTEELPGAEIARMVRSGAYDFATRSDEPRLIELVHEVLESGQSSAKAETQEISRYKALEESLRIKECAIASSITAIGIADLDTRLTYVNHALLNLWKYSSAEEMLGRLIAEFWEYPQQLKELSREIRSKGFYHGIMVARLSDGSLADIEFTTNFVFDETGKRIALLGSFIDVTDRKRIEERLRDSEAQQKAILAALPDMLFRISPAGIFLDFHGPAKATLIPPEIFLGKSVEVVLPTPVGSKAMAAIERIGLTGQPQNLDYEIVYGTDPRYFETRLIPVEGNLDVLAIIRDITERKQAENALITNEKRYRQMFEFHGLPNIMVDPQTGNLVEANPAACEYYGYDLATLKTLNIADITIIKEAEIRERLAKAATGRMISFRAVHRLANGSLRVVQVFSGPIEFEGRQLLYSTITDITEQERVKAALEEVNLLLEQRVAERTAELETVKNRLEAIFNHSGDAILLLDLEYNIQQANNALNEIFGLPPGDPAGQKLTALFPPSAKDTLEVSIRQVAATHQKQHIEAVASRPDGTTFNIEISLAPVNRSNQPVSNLVCLIRDITERKQAELTIHDSEERYRRTVASMSEGLVVQDRNGVIQLCNQAAEHILGLSARQMMGLTSVDPSWEAIHEDGSPFPGETHPAMYTLNTGQPQPNVVMGVHKPDNSLTWILVNSQPLLDHNQQVFAALTTFTDITERKLAEEKLQIALEKEKELGELKSRFVSMASHEFRTPLASILVSAEMLLMYRDRMESSNIDIRLDKIRRHVLHLKHIMDDILQLTRMQAGRVGFRPEPGDLNTLCLEIIEEFESQPANEGRITYACVLAPVFLDFDPNLMRRVINNLISNALKYSPDECGVKVEISREDTQVMIKVKDEGIGIPEEELKHLFEPFHRASNVGTIPGTGLGLTITKQSVDLHGGKLLVESKVGNGTTMIVTIPVTRHR